MVFQTNATRDSKLNTPCIRTCKSSKCLKTDRWRWLYDYNDNGTRKTNHTSLKSRASSSLVTSVNLISAFASPESLAARQFSCIKMKLLVFFYKNIIEIFPLYISLFTYWISLYSYTFPNRIKKKAHLKTYMFHRKMSGVKTYDH